MKEVEFTTRRGGKEEGRGSWRHMGEEGGNYRQEGEIGRKECLGFGGGPEAREM